jgi:aspartate kinase
MLMAHGFLKKVFDIFDEYKTPVDLITTSEVAVTLTIDDTRNLEPILKSLRSFSNVEVEQPQTIICVVGDFLAQNPGMASRVFDSLRDIPISLISYGGSSHNITLLVDGAKKIDALKALQQVVNNPQTVSTVNDGNTSI